MRWVENSTKIHVKFVCRNSDIFSTLDGLNGRFKDYETGADSGDDLEEENFSKYIHHTLF